MLTNWDGRSYISVAADGYSYRTDERSNVAFFPLFPLLGKMVHLVTGLSLEWSLVLVSNLAFAAAIGFLGAYAREVDPTRDDFPAWVVLSLALWPVSLFFRVAYSESLFLLLTVLVMYGIRRCWPGVLVAVICAFCTATRAVGVATLAVFAVHLIRQFAAERVTAARTVKLLGLLSIASTGVVAYGTFLHVNFRDGLAFARTQDNWAVREANMLDQVYHATVFEPILSKYDPRSEAHWSRRGESRYAVFNLDFANPIILIGSVGLVAYGAFRRWLNSSEILLAVGLLGIPYFFHSYRMCMLGQARFALVVFPCFLVMGRLLDRIPAPLATLLVVMTATMLLFYSALFAAWYPII